MISAFEKNCTEILTTSPGVIKAPDIDDDLFYDYNIDCHWKIKGPEGSYVSFEITNIDIELSNDCKNDYMSVCFI